MSTEEMNKLTEKIIGCAIEVHKTLGPGLLESVYEECLAIELEYNGIKFVPQQRLPKVGLLINFNVPLLKQGIRRMVL